METESTFEILDMYRSNGTAYVTIELSNGDIIDITIARYEEIAPRDLAEQARSRAISEGYLG